MRLIAKSTLAAFWQRHPMSRTSLESWLKIITGANWTSMNDVQTTLPNAVVLNAHRIKFEIGGGKFRLVVAVHFPAQIVFINFIGTHAEYDKVDALTVSRF